MIVHLEDAGTLPTRPIFKYPISLEPMEPIDLSRHGETQTELELSINEVLAVRISVKGRDRGRTLIYLGNRLIYLRNTILSNEKLWITIERLFEEKYNAKVKRIIP